MTNQELIEEFKLDPSRRMSSSYFRSFNGILFNRVANCEVFGDTWYPIYICDEVGLLNYCPSSYLPDRNYYAVRKAIDSLHTFFTQKQTVVRIKSSSELPKDLRQPLRLQNVPDRKKFIKDIMEFHFKATFPRNYNTYEHSSEFNIEEVQEEAYNVAWEFALTSVARRYVQAKTKVETGLNQLVSDQSFNNIPALLDRIRRAVKSDDIEKAEDLQHKLKVKTGELGSALGKLSSNIWAAKNNACVISLQQILPLNRPYMSVEEFTKSWLSSADIMSIEDDNILKGWSNFCSFLSKLDIEIPKPFGIPLNLDNVSKMAAFWNTSGESYINFKDHLDRILESRKVWRNTTDPEPTVLLG